MKPIFFMVSSTLVLLSLSGCVSAPTPTMTAPVPLPLSYKMLNSDSVHLRVGAVYILRRDSLTEIIRILDERSLSDPPGWTTTIESRFTKEKELATLPVGRLDGFCASHNVITRMFARSTCPAGSPVVVSIDIGNTRTEKLLDPFVLLEIVNRPVSGLEYNREAEGRVMQWRTSMAQAVSERNNSAGDHVSICTQISTSAGNSLTVQGRISVQDATEIVHRIAAASDLTINESGIHSETRDQANRYTFPIEGTIVSSAEFRDLGLVDVSTSPRIDYRLGGVSKLDVSSP